MTEAESEKQPDAPRTYDASSIQVLEGLEAVRKRPGMYIWNTSFEGLHHLIWEVLDNSIDECMAGHAKEIEVVLHEDGSCSVTDDGRGIPTEMHKSENMPALELVMTKLHAGGKFDRDSYKVSGGLHGVGVSVVNALSTLLTVTVDRNGKTYEMAFSRGHKTGEMRLLGDTTRRGTRVRFFPDATIFDTVEFDWDTVAKRCRELAYLLGRRGLSLKLRSELLQREQVYHFPEGIAAFVSNVTANKELVHKDVIHIRQEDVPNPLAPDGEKGPLYAVEVALQYTSEYVENVFCFANNINTVEGGSHLSGFRSALTRTFNTYAKKEKLLKDSDKVPTGDDFREGLVAVINVSVPEPQFGGQTKSKLGNREVQSIVESVVAKHLEIYFEENPATAKAIFKKGLEAQRAREAARKARDLARRKSTLASGNLPKKLADCMWTDADRCELFLVEGDSAGGTAKMGRQPEFQAILPLRGKILNVEKARLDKMLAHNEIQAIISALGTGIGLEEFDLSKLRYAKVIIMTDADVDGSHIRTLLLTFFFRHMRELIERGHVYIAEPPLFRVKHKGKERYLANEEEKNEAVLSIIVDNSKLLDRKSGREFSGPDLERLNQVLGRLEKRIGRAVPIWSTVRAEDFLQRFTIDGVLPHAALVVHRKPRWSRDVAGMEQLRLQLSAELGREAKIYTGPDSLVPRDDADATAVTFQHADELAEMLEDLRALGVADGFELPSEDALDVIPRFQVANTKKSRDVLSLLRVRPTLVEFGSDHSAGGAEVQRYKGLGEMNAEQLFDTAMNPDTRSLKRVRLEDAVTADLIFSVLMGTGVEQRREFIERHALEVTNLDI
ncbi:MAG: DNA topoisomerase (ATP-hydrolyzing) subunit B [Planctomycetes bacterium]|nr:DNA topoisomerase (ATP-hydrolyzing) subunit B [Planctomycetota bacterium]